MHEMSLCQGVLQVIQDHALKDGFIRVKTVWLEIGELAGVEIEAMRFSFDVVTRGTLADRSRLEIIELAGSAWCLPCEKKVRVRRRFEECPDCGGYKLRIVGGDEMRIKELEVE